MAQTNKPRRCKEDPSFCRNCYGYGVCEEQPKPKPFADCAHHDCNWYAILEEDVHPDCELFCLRWMKFHGWYKRRLKA
jgi:hypothetical protein